MVVLSPDVYFAALSDYFEQMSILKLKWDVLGICGGSGKN